MLVCVSELRTCETSAEWDYLTVPHNTWADVSRRPAVLAEVPSGGMDDSTPGQLPARLVPC
jgi:hypothetical protein